MRILVLGDSLGLPRPHRINNYSPSETDLAVSYDQTYPSIIQKTLMAELYSEDYFEVINRSKRLCNLKNILSEFGDYLFFYQPDVIILQIGIVDCWFREKRTQIVNLKEFEQIFNQIIEMLKLRPNCKLIIVGISPTSEKMDNRYVGQNQEIKKYNNIYKTHVDNNKTFYIDMESFIDPKFANEYLLPDDHHLNVDGNKLVSQELLKIIRSIFYCKKGATNYEKANLEEAYSDFKNAFIEYPYFEDNIFNFTQMLMEFGQNEELEIVKAFCKENIKNQEIRDFLLI